MRRRLMDLYGERIVLDIEKAVRAEAIATERARINDIQQLCDHGSSVTYPKGYPGHEDGGTVVNGCKCICDFLAIVNGEAS